MADMVGKFLFVLVLLLVKNHTPARAIQDLGDMRASLAAPRAVDRNTAAMDAGECIQSSCLGLLVAICIGNITFVSFDLRHKQLHLKIVAASIINLMF